MIKRIARAASAALACAGLTLPAAQADATTPPPEGTVQVVTAQIPDGQAGSIQVSVTADDYLWTIGADGTRHASPSTGGGITGGEVDLTRSDGAQVTLPFAAGQRVSGDADSGTYTVTMQVSAADAIRDRTWTLTGGSVSDAAGDTAALSVDAFSRTVLVMHYGDPLPPVCGGACGPGTGTISPINAPTGGGSAPFKVEASCIGGGIARLAYGGGIDPHASYVLQRRRGGRWVDVRTKFSELITVRWGAHGKIRSRRSGDGVLTWAARRGTYRVFAHSTTQPSYDGPTVAWDYAPGVKAISIESAKRASIGATRFKACLPGRVMTSRSWHADRHTHLKTTTYWTAKF